VEEKEALRKEIEGAKTIMQDEELVKTVHSKFKQLIDSVNRDRFMSSEGVLKEMIERKEARGFEYFDPKYAVKPKQFSKTRLTFKTQQTEKSPCLQRERDQGLEEGSLQSVASRTHRQQVSDKLSATMYRRNSQTITANKTSMFQFDSRPLAISQLA
jgi:hypothetical protein